MITRVGFDRTELSLMLSCTEFCALSSGHALREGVLKGFAKPWIFMIFGGSKMGKSMKMQDEHGQILVSRALDLNKTRVGFGRTEVSVRLDGKVVCVISSGHGPRNPCFQGGSKSLDFHDFYRGGPT